MDFSRVALSVASRRAADRGVAARFVLGGLDATGLPDASVTAAVSVDSVQFAEPLSAGLAELRRVVAPGGRMVLTGWVAHDLDDERVSPRLRQDVRAELVATGFTDVVERDEPGWRRFEQAMWQAAAAHPEDPADPALVSMQGEARRSLDVFDRIRRSWWVARA
ncbi:ubiquinone/menaquinone biosynthesis C-methylase UbiE [Cellulomonas sp. URHB0016]